MFNDEGIIDLQRRVYTDKKGFVFYQIFLSSAFAIFQDIVLFVSRVYKLVSSTGGWD